MADVLITNGTVVTPDAVLDPGWLTVRDGRITEVGAGTPMPIGLRRVDAHGGWILPGFVDIHCHGGGGGSFAGQGVEGMVTTIETHRTRGTTTMLASLVSRPVPELAKQIAELAGLVTDGLLAGIHLEGPFLAAARCGAHDPAVLRPPDRETVDTLLDAGRGTVRMVTLAPELDGAVEAVRRLAGAGVLAAIGHTDAIEAQVRPAIEAGARVATHLFNGMRPLHHREPGPIGALLDDDRVSIELICDLVHVHPTAVRLAHAGAGPGRMVLVTDAIAAAGAGDGRYDIGGLDVTVRDGVPTLAGGAALAGSSLTMDAAFRNLVRECGIPVLDAVAATSAHPAALLGLGGETGKLAPGLAADVVILDAAMHPVSVMSKGAWVD